MAHLAAQKRNAPRKERMGGERGGAAGSQVQQNQDKGDSKCW